ncbi:MAG: SGNH/GDSL hydrolase family protein, partial [Verrucomicrobiota bacterium]
MTWRRRALYGCALWGLLFLGAEFVTRAVNRYVPGAGFAVTRDVGHPERPGIHPAGEMIRDSEFGVIQNTGAVERVRKNACGEEVVWKPPADPHITRFPRHSDGISILFLGDSFTHALQVSTGRAYYDVLEERAGARFSVFAAAMSGYGHAQEFLLLNKVYDRIRPDIVVWQLTNNDVRDNVYVFDRKALINGAKKPKPYYDPDTGRMEVVHPGGWWLRNSAFCRFLFHAAVTLDHRFQWKLMKRLEKRRRPKGEQLRALHARGLRVLDALLAKAKAAYP